ncbi:hypothetical protein DFH09DRAFT_925035 [Mycena vulgaris]|nr:hypothetical protein DFH09DRAFT_925035 [Mycena vulgaris]
MRLKSYTEIDQAKRAPWNYVADTHIARLDKTTSTVQKGSHINMFLQRWSPVRHKLPPHLKDMVNMARKYGTQFDTPNPSRELWGLLPLWHHFGEDPNKRQLNNKSQCKCLRGRHNAHTVGDATTIMARLDRDDHAPTRDCICPDCESDRTNKGCLNPHSCALATQKRVTELLPKWNPTTPNAHREFSREEDSEMSTTFQDVAQITNLADEFRVFTKAQQDEGYIAEIAPYAAHPYDPVTLYPGAVCKKGGEADAVTGAGIYMADGDTGNRS